MAAIFSPSMMCAEYGHLENEVEILEKAGVDRFHLDVMDGRFVPNFGMGLQDIEFICKKAKVKKEIHLMIERPGEYVEQFVRLGADIIYIHPEADYHPATTLQKVFESGVEAGVVLSPGTSIESVIEILNIAKHVMVMGINPGHAGQIYIPYVDKKIEKLLKIKDEYGLEIMIDGACSAEKIERWSAQGVDGFVLGTAALFKKNEDYGKIIASLRKISRGG